MEGKCYIFSGYKKRNNVRLIYLKCKPRQDSWFMHFQLYNAGKRKEEHI